MYDLPEYSMQPSPRWVRAYFNGQLIADSRAMVLFFERPYPNYFFSKTPRAYGLSPHKRSYGRPRATR